MSDTEEREKVEQQHESIKNIENAIRYAITPKQLFGLAVSCFTCACVIVGAFYSAKNYFLGKDQSNTVQFAKINERMDVKDKKDSLNTTVILLLLEKSKKEDSLDKIVIRRSVDSNRQNIANLYKKYNYILSFSSRPFKIVNGKRVY